MSRRFLTAVDFNQNEIQNSRQQNLTSPPPSPVAGQSYFNTALNAIYHYNGTSWQPADASQSTIIPSTAIVNFQSIIQGYHLNQFATPTANIAMAGFKLTGLNVAPTTAGDSAEYSWTLSRALNNFTGTVTANVPMGGFTFSGLNTAPSAAGQAAEYSWVVGRSLATVAAGTASAGPITASGQKIISLAAPSVSGDAVEYSFLAARSLNFFTGALTSNFSLGGTFTLSGVPAPTAAGQVAEYSWVVAQLQSAAAGISSKPPVQCVAASSITLSGLQTIDGYTTVAGDRVLVTAQTPGSANGVYNAATGAWTRTTVDGPAPGELEPGALWLVAGGTLYGGTQWREAGAGLVTVGTTAVQIVQFSASTPYSAGNGIQLSGATFSAVANPAAGSGIVVTGSGIAIDLAVVGRKYTAAIGDGTTTAIVVTHGLGTQDVIMGVKSATTPFATIDCDMAATSTNTSTFTFASAPTLAQFRATVIG